MKPLVVVEIADEITSRAGRVLALLGHEVVQFGAAVANEPWNVGKAVTAETDLTTLVGGADVVLVGAEHAARADEFAAMGPHVVVATPWGRDPARVDRPASAHVVAAAGGWSAQIGRPDGPPISPPDEQAWALAGVAVAIASLIGPPATVSEVAAVDVVSATLETGALAWIHDGRVAPRPGREHPLVLHQLLRAADGWIATGLGGNTAMFERLRDWLAEEGWPALKDASFATESERIRHRARISAALQEFCVARSRTELTREAQARRVPWAGVLDPSEVVSSAQLVERQFFGSTGHAAPRPPWLTTTGPQSATASTRSPGRGERLLDGVTVLDLTWVLAGPFATRILADHGADVIKVESVERPDPTRFSPAMHLGAGREKGSGETSGYFANHNRNKRSLALNLRAPEGLGVLRRLIGASDVVIDNFSAGTLARWGLTREDIWSIRPDVVIAELSGMGQTGPWRDYVSYADVVSALSGLTALTVDDDGEPIGVVFGFADLVAGYHGALAVVSALWERARSGRGAYLDISQLEAMAFNLSSALLGTHERASRVAGQGDIVVRCADGEWCAATVPNDDHPSTIANIRARAERVSAVDLADELSATGIPAARVANGRQLVEGDPQMRPVPMYGSADHPVIGAHLVELDPIIVDGTRPAISRGAPVLGEDTRDVLTGLGGFSPDEVDHLLANGVLQ